MVRGDETPFWASKPLSGVHSLGAVLPSGKAFLAFCFSIPTSSSCARGAHRHWEKTWGGEKQSQAGKHCGIMAPYFGVSAYL